MKQKTLSRSYVFEGKGLHTGKAVRMEVCPAPAGTGIRFQRVDLGNNAFVDAIASNVSRTARSTTLSCGKAKVTTVEHLLSALTGLDVDNALVKLNSKEAPILDGSAKPYVDAMGADPLVEQDAERKWIELDHVIEYKDPRHGGFVRIEPADSLSYECTIDFNSKVLGVQTCCWKPGEDYVNGVAPCRTFCFLHEILKMSSVGLIKGGDLDNAIVIVEKPVKPSQARRISRHFNQEGVNVTDNGYLSNLELRFPDECGRHKLLDLIGDLRLAGGFMKARVTAYKPGHRINTKTAKLI